MPSQEQHNRLQQLSRQHIRIVWEIAGLDESSLNDDDRLLADIMRLHPEYYDLWKRLDEVSPEELERDGNNPVLHITIHQIIENQIAANDPPETAKILQLLIQQGLSRHEAIHQIGTLLAKDIFEAAKSNQDFNKQHYVRRLRQLVRPQRKKGRRGII